MILSCDENTLLLIYITYESKNVRKSETCDVVAPQKITGSQKDSATSENVWRALYVVVHFSVRTHLHRVRRLALNAQGLIDISLFAAVDNARGGRRRVRACGGWFVTFRLSLFF